jgi:sugar phosphate isomerase/epimerase
VVLCIEPNAKHYGCNFITNSQEAHAFVAKVGVPGFEMMLDTGNMALEDEPIIETLERNLDRIAHLHIAARDLRSLTTQPEIPYTAVVSTIAAELKRSGRSRKLRITIETRGVGELELRRSIFRCLVTQ